ncbi:hypothetical protein R1sor_021181 [Riccia sorocarpa]|uniref:YDG domain-containing protein n=1 Tax=Riccia sorocarpa TaxID=122646 RepID=A0ABD3GGB2_9MARC
MKASSVLTVPVLECSVVSLDMNLFSSSFGSDSAELIPELKRYLRIDNITLTSASPRTCRPDDEFEREDGEIDPRSSKWHESMLPASPGEEEESFKYLNVKEEIETRASFPPSTKPAQEFRAALKLNIEERRNAAASALGRPQVGAASSRGFSMTPAKFGLEEARLLVKQFESFECEWSTTDDEELEEGEISPSEGELEGGEFHPTWQQPEDEMKTATSLPPSAAERKEEYPFAGEYQGKNKSGLRRIHEVAEMKPVKDNKPPLDRGKGAELKRVKAEPWNAANEIECKGWMEGATNVRRAKEEPVDAAAPPQATLSNTVLNLPVSHLERKKLSQTEAFRQSDKQQELRHPEEKRADVSIDTSESVEEAVKIFRALAFHFQFEAKDGRRTSGKQPALMRAAGVMNENQLSLPGDIIGEIEGIEVGKRFSSRGEVSVTGLHRELLGGINVVVRKDAAGVETRIGTSVVFGIGDDYSDNEIGVGENDRCIYSGEGGLPSKTSKKGKDKKKLGLGLDRTPTFTDQTLTGGNLALMNSFHEKIPIRVIKGLRRGPDNRDNSKYVYAGLYQILDVLYERGKRGNMVYKFIISLPPKH